MGGWGVVFDSRKEAYRLGSRCWTGSVILGLQSNVKDKSNLELDMRVYTY